MPKELTARSLLTGIVLGILFGAANAYIGLKVGLTVSTSIPVAVMTVAIFSALSKREGSPVLEANFSQTVGSASSSLASGLIFTTPALFLWGQDPELIQLVVLGACGGLLGVMIMVPLRRALIVEEQDKLPYPEGTACANVLRAAEGGGASARPVFVGLGLGALFKFLASFGKMWHGEAAVRVGKAEAGMELSPALLGVGYILGPRIGLLMVLGAAVSWLILIPAFAAYGETSLLFLFSETPTGIGDLEPGKIWNKYIRYVGAGGVATAGVYTIIQSTPMMIRSLKAGLEHLKKRSGDDDDVPRTEQDLSMKIVLAIVGAVLVVVAASPQVLGVSAGIPLRIVGAIGVGIFAFLFVTVSSRIVGLVGVSSNPTSGMTIVTLLGTSLVFYALGWTDMVGKTTALTVGTVVCVAASMAGDVSQDLKTGYLVGATPRTQQLGEIAGILTAITFVASAIILLAGQYEFGSKELPAPQGTLMQTIVEGVLEARVPWGLFLLGAALTIIPIVLRLPPLAVAVGLYLPLATMTPIFAGGLIAMAVNRGKESGPKEVGADPAILAASGLVAGVGFVGVGLSAYGFFTGQKPPGFGIELPTLVGLLLFAGLGYYLARMGKKES